MESHLRVVLEAARSGGSPAGGSAAGGSVAGGSTEGGSRVGGSVWARPEWLVGLRQ